MKKLLVISLILTTAALAEKSHAQRSPNNGNGQTKLSTTEGLINYLKPLPGVVNVQTWDNPYGQGLIIETSHYEIYTTLLEPLMLKQVPSFVEALWQEYQNQIPQPITADASKSKLYLFKERTEWDSFTQSFTGEQWPVYQKIKKGAYYLNGACVAYNIGRTRTFSVIGHEGWHQFCNKYFKYRLPSWLDEGIAQLFETSDLENGRFVFRPAKNYQKLGALKITLQGGRAIPLKDLISLNPGQIVINEQADAATQAFYAQSYALVRFLREANYGKWLGGYYQMMLGAAQGSWPITEEEAKIASDRNIPLTAQWNSYIAQKLFGIYIGPDMKKIEPEFLTFCGKITYRLSVSY